MVTIAIGYRLYYYYINTIIITSRNVTYTNTTTQIYYKKIKYLGI